MTEARHVAVHRGVPDQSAVGQLVWSRRTVGDRLPHRCPA